MTQIFFNRWRTNKSLRISSVGCSDSRIPANAALGLMPGEMFVHRSIANLLIHSDLNRLSVIQFAVEVFNIKDIIVCGHYSCGSVKAALQNLELGLIDNWLRRIQDTARLHEKALKKFDDFKEQTNKLCELNFIEQVLNVANTTFVRKAWKDGRDVTVYGWVYELRDGLIQDLNVNVGDEDQVREMRNKFWSEELN